MTPEDKFRHSFGFGPKADQEREHNQLVKEIATNSVSNYHYGTGLPIEDSIEACISDFQSQLNGSSNTLINDIIKELQKMLKKCK